VVSSGDSHPEGDPEFKVFPPHCLRGTQGARIISEGIAKSFCTIPNDPAFQIPQDILSCPQIVIEKQTLNVFDNPHADAVVEKMDRAAEFIVFGVVTELCVLCAAKGLLERGRQVSIVKDAVESLARAKEGREALNDLQARGARLITTDDAIAKVNQARTSSAH